jgi:di/tricarboxylate transporter
VLTTEFHAAAVLVIIALMVALLVTDRLKTSLVFLLASAALIITGALSVQQYFQGLANLSILTIFLLIIITSGINENFNVAGAFARLFRGVTGSRSFILRMGSGVAGFSAFMNNTPVVAVMMPHVYEWGKKNKVSPGKLLMPLSFAAILGGVITLIGTSTNLVLNGLLQEYDQPTLGFLDFLAPGLIITVVGLVGLVFLAPLFLKDTINPLPNEIEKKREYLVETAIAEQSSLVGKTVEQAGLRNLEGVFLTEIIRKNRPLPAVGPTEVLEAKDVLLFAGNNATIVNLVKNKDGLALSKTDEFNLIDNTEVVEAVVAQNSALDRSNVKEIGFRERYDAAIIGIHRRGEKLSGKIGSIALHTGDLLLLVAGPEFKERNDRNEDMIVLSAQRSRPELPLANKAAFILITALLLGASSFSFISFFESLLGITLAQLALGFLNLDSVKRSISLDLLIILISALALGEALVGSGAADFLTNHLFNSVKNWSPMGLLAGLFFTTVILTSFVTNVAAISIIFPVVFSLSAQAMVPAQALYLTAAYGASCCFITPYAYQTNLMVMELGHYKFSDYFKLGSFVTLLYSASFLTYAYLVFL